MIFCGSTLPVSFDTSATMLGEYSAGFRAGVDDGAVGPLRRVLPGRLPAVGDRQVDGAESRDRRA